MAVRPTTFDPVFDPTSGRRARRGQTPPAAPTPPAGQVFLIADDGAYLVAADGAYLTEPA